MNPARSGARNRRGIRVASAVALIAGVTAVAPGCGSPGSLTQAANDLQSALLSMPGVADAWVYHEESYAEGVIFNIAVDVPAATRQQLVDIADRIDTNHIGLISNYTQNVEFWVTPDRPVTLRRQAHFDAEPDALLDGPLQPARLLQGTDELGRLVEHQLFRETLERPPLRRHGIEHRGVSGPRFSRRGPGWIPW